MTDFARPAGARVADWEAASRALATGYFPHSMTRTALDADGAVFSSHTLGAIRLARISLGTDVNVRSAHPGGYAVNIPLTGRLVSVTRGTEVTSTVGQATICPPDTDTHITEWHRTCEVLGVAFDRHRLEREAALVLAPGQRLPAQLDLTTPGGAAWRRLVESISAQLDDDPGLLTNPLVADHLAAAVTTALLLAAVPAAAPGDRAPRPRIVTRVLDALHADPARVWTAGDMADCAGVGVRRLQEGFRQHLGRSPSECLLEIRLERAHLDLLGAEPWVTVTDIAQRWGFTHSGRFAAAYRARFGTSPSAALRR
ncbi:AraC family transcriptional regulator [Rhodococcus triatomae]